MKFTKKTPRTTETSQGFKVNVPIFFPLDKSYEDLVELFRTQSIPENVVAATLQQVLAIENPRNNVAGLIKKEVITPALVEAIKNDPDGYSETDDKSPPICTIVDGNPTLTWDGKIGSIPDNLRTWLADKHSVAAQKVVDEYYTNYTPGMPKRRGTSGPTLNPIENLARKTFVTEIFAGWKEVQWTDKEGKAWVGVASQARKNSAHEAANKMLAAGDRPSFLAPRIFEVYDGDIPDVNTYVDVYTDMLFSSTANPAVKKKAARLLEDAEETLKRIDVGAEEVASLADSLT